MRAIVVSQALTPQTGGSAVSEASLCAQLQKRCPTSVWCRAGSLDAAFARGFGLTDVKEVNPFEVVRAWRDPSHWIRHALESADVLHLNGHWRWENALLARLAVRQGVPFVFQPRGMLLLELRRVFLKKLFNRALGDWVVKHASRLVALSRFERDEQWKPYAVAEARCEVIPNGIPAPQAPSERIEIPPYFLYFGRMESRKNLLFLVKAFARYVTDGGDADLLFVGPAQRGYENEITRLARELGISHRVRVLPPAYGPEKTAYLHQAVGVVYPAIGEPYGRVPFETVSAGGIPIVPYQSGSQEYLSGFFPETFYSLHDEDALCAALRSAERLTPAQRSERVAPAQAWIAENLDWEKITERVLTMYETVIEESQAARRVVSRAHESAMPAMPRLGRVGE